MKNKYKIRNLVSNISEIYDSKFEDPDLINGWDLAIIDEQIWATANKSGKLIKYDLNGRKITSFDVPNSESPTGLALNIKTGLGSDVLYFVTEQGKLYALNPSLRFPIRLLNDNSNTGALYTGLTKFENLLYATDLHNKKIDVFDSLQNFAQVNLSFIDLDRNNPLPSNYSPFNIINIDQNLYVLYAEKDPNSNDIVVGEGKGYIDIYTIAGTFVRRFVSNGKLNGPTGLTIKNNRHNKSTVMVANFGDGKINEYSMEGKFISTLRDSNKKKIRINGLSALESFNDSIYFIAGPNDEKDGLVGRLKQKIK